MVRADPSTDDPDFVAACRHVDFVVAYIEEAHAEDEWPVRSGRYNRGLGPVRINQPKTAVEREKVAREFFRTYDISLDERLHAFVDDPEAGNPFEKHYAPWPLRLYVIKNSKISWIASPHDCTYDVRQLRQWILAWWLASASDDSRLRATSGDTIVL